MDSATLRLKAGARSPQEPGERQPTRPADPAAPLRLERRADGRLWLLGENGARPVRVRRCFPWSEPDRFLSLCDEDDSEIAFVAEPETLDDDSRAALEHVLAQAGFVFDLVEVFDIEEEVELRHWRVRTGQGTRTFQTRLDDWPRQLPDGALLIRDVCGDLYRLVAPEQLDRKSRSFLWAFID